VKTKTQTLGNFNHRQSEVIRITCFNLIRVEVYFMIANNFTDTDYRYDVYAEVKNKQQAREAQLIADTVASLV